MTYHTPPALLVAIDLRIHEPTHGTGAWPVALLAHVAQDWTPVLSNPPFTGGDMSENSAATVAIEGDAFAKRHAELGPEAAVMGGLAWGLLRALAECPDCPGSFRVPAGQDGLWRCPACGKVGRLGGAA